MRLGGKDTVYIYTVKLFLKGLKILTCTHLRFEVKNPPNALIQILICASLSIFVLVRTKAVAYFNDPL